VVELPESEKSIELDRIYTDRDSMSIVSSDQRFVRTDDFVNDLDSKVPHSQNYSNSNGHSSLLTKSCRSDDPQVRKLKFWCNDDYFPQGEEYENEFRDGRKKKEQNDPNNEPMTCKGTNNFRPALAMLEDNQFISINGDPIMRFVTCVHMTNQMRLDEKESGTILMSKRVSDKDAIEKLQTLIEKVTEFKRRVFRSEINTAKSNVQTNQAKNNVSKNNSKSSNTTNRSSFQGQEVFTSY